MDFLLSQSDNGPSPMAQLHKLDYFPVFNLWWSYLVPFPPCSRKCWGGADLVADAQWNLWNLYIDEGVVHGSSFFHLVNIIHRVLGKARKEHEPLKPSEEIWDPQTSPISLHPWSKLKGNRRNPQPNLTEYPRTSIFLSLGAWPIPLGLFEMTFWPQNSDSSPVPHPSQGPVLLHHLLQSAAEASPLVFLWKSKHTSCCLLSGASAVSEAAMLPQSSGAPP